MAKQQPLKCRFLKVETTDAVGVTMFLVHF